jgi:chemotaxis protein CheD
MREEVLLIGEMKVFDQPVMLKCYGLGSCIGLFVKDRRSGITGAAHIFLPDAVSNVSFTENMAAADCVQAMLEQMKERGASDGNLRAKITGGSNVLMNFNEIGSRNTSEVIAALIRNKIYIAARDVGGVVSRTVKFNSTSEQLVVRQLELNRTKIF